MSRSGKRHFCWITCFCVWVADIHIKFNASVFKKKKGSDTGGMERDRKSRSIKGWEMERDEKEPEWLRCNPSSSW